MPLTQQAKCQLRCFDCGYLLLYPSIFKRADSDQQKSQRYYCQLDSDPSSIPLTMKEYNKLLKNYKSGCLCHSCLKVFFMNFIHIAPLLTLDSHEQSNQEMKQYYPYLFSCVTQQNLKQFNMCMKQYLIDFFKRGLKIIDSNNDDPPFLMFNLSKDGLRDFQCLDLDKEVFAPINKLQELKVLRIAKPNKNLKVFKIVEEEEIDFDTLQISHMKQSRNLLTDSIFEPKHTTTTATDPMKRYTAKKTDKGSESVSFNTRPMTSSHISNKPMKESHHQKPSQQIEESSEEELPHPTNFTQTDASNNPYQNLNSDLLLQQVPTQQRDTRNQDLGSFVSRESAALSSKGKVYQNKDVRKRESTLFKVRQSQGGTVYILNDQLKKGEVPTPPRSSTSSENQSLQTFGDQEKPSQFGQNLPPLKNMAELQEYVKKLNRKNRGEQTLKEAEFERQQLIAKQKGMKKKVELQTTMNDQTTTLPMIGGNRVQEQGIRGGLKSKGDRQQI